MARTSITNQRKLTILRDADQRTANGESLKSVARSHGVQPAQIRSWRKVREKLKLLNPKARSIARGRPSSIKHLEEQIIGWGIEMRELGVGISYRHLQLKACRADANFAQKTQTQQYQVIRTLCRQNKWVCRRKTHVAQDNPQVGIDKAKEWLLEIRPLLSVPTVNKTYVINMDQTPVPFSLSSNSTLNLMGGRTITVRATGNEKTRCTVSLTVCADGTKLKPMVIFKGTRTGRIATRELSQSPYRNKLVLTVQPNAWQDEENMNDWVDGVLVPHLQQRAAGSPVKLFLDQFSAHETEGLKARMGELGVQLELIPAGCTWLLQPIDVGIGKPFKDRLRQKWWEWMVGPAEVDAIIPNPSRDEIQEWVSEVWDAMPQDVIVNSWKKTGFSWFD
jgi:transposase-like protein